MSKRMSAFVLTPIRVTPRIADSMVEESKKVLQVKRQKRISAMNSIVDNRTVEDLNKFCEMDADSRMFDSYVVPREPTRFQAIARRLHQRDFDEPMND